MTPEHSPLGKATAYAEQYDPTLRFPIARSQAREAIEQLHMDKPADAAPGTKGRGR